MNLNSNIKFHNTLQNDPWSWPMLNKKDTMYLSTIKDTDLGMNKYNRSVQNRILDTQDINSKKEKLHPRETSSLKTDDIPRSCPKKLFNFIERPYNKFNNDDIDKCKPRAKHFMTNRPVTDPLNPVYDLPTELPLEPYEPKFIRDAMNIDDIRGTKPKIKIKDLNRGLPTNFVDDIVEKEKHKKFERTTLLDSLYVEDINNKTKFKSKRVTNPLEPQYVYRFKGEDPILIGEIEKNKSKIRHRYVNKEDYNLQTKDVEGAQVSTYGNKMFKEEVR